MIFTVCSLGQQSTMLWPIWGELARKNWRISMERLDSSGNTSMKPTLLVYGEYFVINLCSQNAVLSGRLTFFNSFHFTGYSHEQVMTLAQPSVISKAPSRAYTRSNPMIRPIIIPLLVPRSSFGPRLHILQPSKGRMRSERRLIDGKRKQRERSKSDRRGFGDLLLWLKG